MADRLFVSHRLAELDTAIREARLQPPFWGADGQATQLDRLAAFAAQHGVDPAAPR